MSGPRSPALAVALVLLLVVSGTLVALPAAAPAARAAPTATTPVSGSITGPTLVSIGATSDYHVSGWNGPAVAANGTLVGVVGFYANVVGPNVTGVSLSPPAANFSSNRSLTVLLVVTNVTQTLAIHVMVSSTYSGRNESTNFTYFVHVVVPYVISATIVNPSSSTVTGFTAWVTLDGAVVGQVNVTTLVSGASFPVTFKYPTLGLSVGSHTFAISLVQEHGLVTFANGQTVYTVTVYVTGPAPDYTLWYVAGIVAFFAAVFIFLTRVAARRRGAVRR